MNFYVKMKKLLTTPSYRPKEKRPKTYFEYLTSKNLDFNDKYSQKRENAYYNYKNAMRNQKAIGENLSRKGLQNSGYSNYLKSNLNDKYNREIDKLESEFRDKSLRASRGYEDYLRRYDEQFGNLKNKVKSDLLDSNIVDVEKAYNFAKNAGVGEVDSLRLAKEIYTVNMKKLFREIMIAAAHSRMDPEGVVKYAKDLGISSEDAKKLEDYLRGYEDHFNQMSQDYYDKVENLGGHDTVTYPPFIYR